MANMVRVSVEMTDDQATDYANFYKRLTFSTILELTDPHQPPLGRETEAYGMRNALDVIAKALREQGYDPR